MELKQIKELMAAMERAGLKKLLIKEKTGFELQLERQDDHAVVQAPPAPAYSPFYSAPHLHHHKEEHHPRPPASSLPTRDGQHEAAPAKEEKGKCVLSPMVGTFYNAPSPDDPAFVKVGDRVDENTVLCIIEAMKVMNEVKAGMSGTVAEVLVDNAHPVEFGTKLFRIV
ncbi:MAG: acetyl-CoA carboxylase biotin carboxyl carrier protein [Chlamydiales bacterium]|nr:acetyl-CoA carboxylase biotin carboxyl carrier protein [Chlamydiales bacterium]